ncbi:transposase [Streptomyces bobili]|uniref:transposase n=1 Tax=Streptomyces bobili TaxID=67280 RepID=UPI00382101B6
MAVTRSADTSGCDGATAHRGPAGHQRGLQDPHRVSWRDPPERYGPWQTVYTRFRRYALDGVFTSALQQIQTRPTRPATSTRSGTGSNAGAVLPTHPRRARHRPPEELAGSRQSPWPPRTHEQHRPSRRGLLSYQQTAAPSHSRQE